MGFPAGFDIFLLTTMTVKNGATEQLGFRYRYSYARRPPSAKVSHDWSTYRGDDGGMWSRIFRTDLEALVRSVPVYIAYQRALDDYGNYGGFLILQQTKAKNRQTQVSVTGHVFLQAESQSRLLSFICKKIL